VNRAASRFRTGPRTKVQTWKPRVAPLLLAAALGLILGLTSVGIGLHQGVAVWRAQLHPRVASGQVALVEIDARSLAAFRRWPWPRTHYADAIAALQRQHVGAIAFDVDFSSPSTPANDAALARAISASDVPVILPTFRQAASQSGSGIIENLPLGIFRPKAQLAAVNIYADADGLVRSYPYAVQTGGITRPSIGGMLAGASGRADTGFPIDVSIDPVSIPHVSFVDLVEGRVPPNFLRGRGVLIGSSAVELGDFYPVPGEGMLPGPLIQLLAAETLLQHSSPTDLGFGLPLLLALGLVWQITGGGARRRLLVFGIGVVALVTLPIVTEVAKVGTFNIVPAVGGLIGGLIASIILLALAAAREARVTDPETGLANGRALRARLRTPEAAAVVALRVANYGDVAGVLGTSRAAELVSRVAQRLAFVSDGPVYRVEESALAWLFLSADADEQVERIDAAAALLRSAVEIGCQQIQLNCGFGLVSAERNDPIARAIHAADRAVTRSLRWVRHTDDLEKESAWRLALAQELDRAMAAGDIWVAYQPKLDIRTGRIRACEALVRWRHPERGPMPPDAFIPVLEESGRIADLTLHVLELAMSDRRAWATGGAELDVAVNVSALLPADQEFVRRLEELLAHYPDVVPHLTLEVTESATMVDPEAAVRALDRLAALGICLSIDDYGTGQSTLSYLKRLPAREIKIDKGFVLALETSRSDQAMVRSTIELAHELGFKVVAEGVETEAALQTLRSYGCDTAQGWHIGRPVPPGDLLTLATANARDAA
jgi:EAL domain-containing protein (putative c-di-GMP-specific phosphodiesterase class I)/CHASE2 domain-containing sensor protein/alkylated DNA nucleotide flippase Atl1